MSKNIILDCDGVLLNWRDAFNEWAVNFNFITDDWEPKLYDFYNSIKLPSTYHNALLEIFNQTHYVSNLAPIPGAIKGVKDLIAQGHRLKISTAFSSNYESMKMREKNLIKVFGDVFQEISAVSNGQEKITFLKSQPLDSVFYEDSPSHLLDALDIGYNINNLYLHPQPWNKEWLSDLENYNRFSYNYLNWKQFVKDINGE